jgi:hypothetical protein
VALGLRGFFITSNVADVDDHWRDELTHRQDCQAHWRSSCWRTADWASQNIN